MANAEQHTAYTATSRHTKLWKKGVPKPSQTAGWCVLRAQRPLQRSVSSTPCCRLTGGGTQALTKRGRRSVRAKPEHKDDHESSDGRSVRAQTRLLTFRSSSEAASQASASSVDSGDMEEALSQVGSSKRGSQVRHALFALASTLTAAFRFKCFCSA